MRVKLAVFAFGAATVFVATGCGEGEPIPPPERPVPSQAAQAITNGAVHSKPWHVTTMESIGACSGTIYKRQWVITAAHCIPAWWDANADGFISATELATTANGWRGFLRVAGGANASGAETAFNADAIYKPAATQWGTGFNNNDIALVHLPSPGFVPEAISDHTFFYHNNASGIKVLNLDQWPTNTLGVTSHVDGCGWSNDLRCGTASVSVTAPTYFDVTGPGGISCGGDSGGAGFWWGGNVWGSGNVAYHVGIISLGDCSNSGSYNSTYNNKAWIESIAGS
jgi:hypothetical protein